MKHKYITSLLYYKIKVSNNPLIKKDEDFKPRLNLKGYLLNYSFRHFSPQVQSIIFM